MSFPPEIFVDSSYDGNLKHIPTTKEYALFNFGEEVTDKNCYELIEVLNTYSVKVFPTILAEFVRSEEKYNKICNYIKYSLKNSICRSPLLDFIKITEKIDNFKILKYAISLGSSESLESAIIMYEYQRDIFNDIIRCNDLWALKYIGRLDLLIKNDDLFRELVMNDYHEMFEYYINKWAPEVENIIYLLVLYHPIKIIKEICKKVGVASEFVQDLLKRAAQKKNKIVIRLIFNSNTRYFINQFKNMILEGDLVLISVYMDIFDLLQGDIEFMNSHASEEVKFLVNTRTRNMSNITHQNYGYNGEYAYSAQSRSYEPDSALQSRFYEPTPYTYRRDYSDVLVTTTSMNYHNSNRSAEENKNSSRDAANLVNMDDDPIYLDGNASSLYEDDLDDLDDGDPDSFKEVGSLPDITEFIEGI